MIFKKCEVLLQKRNFNAIEGYRNTLCLIMWTWLNIAYYDDGINGYF